MKSTIKNNEINPALGVILGRFLRNTRTTPERLLGFRMSYRNAVRSMIISIAFLLSMIGIRGFLIMWADEYDFAVRVWALEFLLGLVLAIVSSFRFFSINVYAEYSWYRDLMSHFDKARQAFEKHFGVDVLKCRDEAALKLRVKSRLFEKAYEVAAFNGKADQFEMSKELRKMWDVADMFISVPSYKALFGT